MTDYSAYRNAAGITTKQMVKAVAEEFPRFSKIQCSMVNNTEYGVCLLPEAERLLIDRFGYAPGLSIGEEEGKKEKAVVRRADNRKKRNRFIVRLDDSTAYRVREMMTEMGYTRTQDFLEDALDSMLQNWEASHG